MIHQDAIKIKVAETDGSLINFPGMAPLSYLGKRLGLFADLDRFIRAKQHARALSNGASVFDLMCLSLSGR